MGLIKAAFGAAGGALADQWKEYFYCESIDAGVLAVKGQKREDKRSSNTKGTENIISNGAVIAIADGQAMMIVDQGKVVEFSAEPGEYTYDVSSEPSIFHGNLGESIKQTFVNIGKRFAFGGQPGKDQRVYYFNLKEIVGNKYGTPNPVPFRVVDKNIGLDVDISIRCNGEYSYRLTDPMLFYTNVCGNVNYEYRRDEIDSMLKSELLTALQPAFAKISDMGIRYSSLPGHTIELANALNEALSEKWTKLRGISISSFGVNSVTASPEDEDMITELQRTAVMRNPGMAGANLVSAQADAMKAAAANENGAMMGFLGMNAAMNANPNAGTFYNMDASQQAAGAIVGGESKEEGWQCYCGTRNTSKFCVECGKPKPVNNWTCSCGVVNEGKFCKECGKPKPSDSVKCNKCGWESTTKPPPKFCPECGNKIE
ncbi:MAG: SPFH domain-containing protein [Lachnoclostridium sp.]|jgi:membrane protease subunit (stomatin/prohibitin family)|nr:SPFH domain-containing protein [Lachnoclostridium sp.]